jgi:hypothetical protein
MPLAGALQHGRRRRVRRHVLRSRRVSVKPGREDAVALKDLLLDPACTAGNIAALLRTWPTAT